MCCVLKETTSWDIEEGLLGTMPQWLAQSPMQRLAKINEVLAGPEAVIADNSVKTVSGAAQ